ncbi:MAG: ComEC/Rec2 family competence protein, partial [Acidobacteriota bacterium]
MPAVGAAAALVAGILLGARSRGGEGGSLVLVALSLALALRSSEREGVRRASGLLCWAAVGFFEGRVAIARPEDIARAAFGSLPSGSERADRIEGVLSDFWSGSPPRARGRLSAERLRVGGEWRDFRAEVFLFVSGSADVGSAADRGDRVSITGHMRREDLPASDRDVRLPWTRYRLSIKSANQVRSEGKTLLSRLSAPNRFLHGRLPGAGSRDAAFDRDVRGPLAALLLGRTSELDRGMVARYRRGGLYHLLVVSGMHVGLAAGLVVGALGLARVGGKRRDAILLAAVFLFVLVGGANPPAVRAGVVVAVFLASRLFERPIPPGQAIGLSALVLFVADPKQVYSIGTLLTFAAVGGIALATEPIRRRLPARPNPLFSGIATSLAAQ